MPAPAHRPPPLSLRLRASALPGALSVVRRRIGRWATAIGMSSTSVEDLVLATHEALANVADHAYSEGDGQAWLDADCREGRVVVVVRDEGCWRPPAVDPGWRGRGLLLIRGLAERVAVRHTATGTTVEMSWSLS